MIWWIDRFTVRRGHYYRYRLSGRNDHRGGESFHWDVPNLRGGYAFALRVVAPTCAQCGAPAQEATGRPICFRCAYPGTP